MTTSIFEIDYMDGRKFKVFCANKTQIRKVLIKHHDLKTRGVIKECKEINSWIHTAKQYLNFNH